MDAENRQTSIQQRWNSRYQETNGHPQPARVLQDNQHLLPTEGRALDLACGLGGNALLLAERGLHTWAWDVSDVAVARLQETARRRQLPLSAEIRDVLAAPPLPKSFDVIVVSRFLERSLAPFLIQALHPGGLLLYQTFTHTSSRPAGPTNPAYLLTPQELLTLFRPLRLIVYREEGQCGDTTRGLRHEALLIGQQPETA